MTTKIFYMIISLVATHGKVKKTDSCQLRLIMKEYKMNPDIKNCIQYEDSQIIVCHKPAGIPVQSGRIGTPDMVSLLKNYLAASQRSASAGQSSASGRNSAAGHSSAASRNTAARAPYLGVIHRLDQPVEGLLVFAKTPAAAKNLSQQLTSAGFGIYYLAVVRGKPEKDSDTLEDYLVKDGRTNTSRVCPKETAGAKSARLSYRTLDSRDGRSLLEIHLDTGRHHQIRVQMTHLGCPLIGDRKYGQKESTEPLRLCAFKLEFLHPEDGRKMKFELPPDACPRL